MLIKATEDKMGLMKRKVEEEILIHFSVFLLHQCGLQKKQKKPKTKTKTDLLFKFSVEKSFHECVSENPQNLSAVSGGNKRREFCVCEPVVSPSL